MNENTDTSIANLPVVNEGRLVFPKFNLQTDSTLLIGRNSLDDRVNGAPTVRIDLNAIPTWKSRKGFGGFLSTRRMYVRRVALASISDIYANCPSFLLPRRGWLPWMHPPWVVWKLCRYFPVAIAFFKSFRFVYKRWTQVLVAIGELSKCA